MIQLDHLLVKLTIAIKYRHKTAAAFSSICNKVAFLSVEKLT